MSRSELAGLLHKSKDEFIHSLQQRKPQNVVDFHRKATMEYYRQIAAMELDQLERNVLAKASDIANAMCSR